MITKTTDIQAIRSVAINVAPEAVEPFIDDVEKQDVIPVIGAELYLKIDANPSDAKYKEILHGGTYTDCCGIQKYSRGLIAAVAYLAYSRLLTFGDIQYTAFGSVLKNTQYSQKPAEVEKIRAADAAKKMGFAILQTVADYVKVNFDASCCNPNRVSRPKFISIKKDRI
jgi:hypothetical protein